jgi:hypothetical protein
MRNARPGVLALLLICGLPVSAEVVQIGVFSLFRPVEFRVMPVSTPLLILTGDAQVILEGRHIYTIMSPVRVSARDGSDTDFRLSIPGRIERQFHGTLSVRSGGHKLIAVVAMDRDVAVASVVAAEMPTSAHLEALKAQAIVARSYYVAAGPRHDGFEFCDTTHCQFLREWPATSADAFRATQETRDLLLAYLGKPLAALYSASCGGQTRSLEDPGAGYQYYSVSCDFCRRHSPGLVQGHQLGLCQRGAAGMAAAGAGFREILDYYYPGTSLKQTGPNAIFLLPPPPAMRHSKERLSSGKM